jgi:hypothetical protein
MAIAMPMGVRFFQVEKELDAVDIGRGWIVVNHAPALNSEVVASNGVITSNYSIVSNVLHFSPILELGDTLFIKYAY